MSSELDRLHAWQDAVKEARKAAIFLDCSEALKSVGGSGSGLETITVGQLFDSFARNGVLVHFSTTRSPYTPKELEQGV